MAHVPIYRLIVFIGRGNGILLLVHQIKGKQTGRIRAIESKREANSTTFTSNFPLPKKKLCV